MACARMNEGMPAADIMSRPETETPDRDAAPTSPLAGSAAIFVLGMHRSGTSAFTGILHRLGVTLGERLLVASPENPKGYWEHFDVVRLQDILLAALGTSWREIGPLPTGWENSDPARQIRDELRKILLRDFAATKLWGVKDPRLCRLMPLWAPLIEELGFVPRFVLMQRDAGEVAASLLKRDGISLARGRLLWLRHTLEAEAASRDAPRIILRYADLLKPGEWRPMMQRVARELGVTWPVTLNNAAREIEKFVTPDLKHQSGGTKEPGAVADWVATVEAAFDQGDGPALREICDRVRSELAGADLMLAPIVAEQERELAALRAKAPAPARPPAAETPKPQASGTEPDYAKWIASRASQPYARLNWVSERVNAWPFMPRLALGMVLPAGTEPRLAATLRSLQGQMLGDWELHVAAASPAPPSLASEPRVHWHQETTPGVATINRALIGSSAHFVALMDGGDRLAPHALFAIGDALLRHREWHAAYSDEDRIDEAGTRSGAHFKPDFNLDLLRSMPYTGGLLAVRREIFAELGGFDPRWDGLEEHDLALRLAERGGKNFGHVADVLFHRFLNSGRSRRPVPEICADLPRVVQAHLDRSGVKGVAGPGAGPLFCRVQYAHDGDPPPVSIIVPTKNQLPLLKRCIETVLQNTAYQNYELIVIDNGSTDHDAIEYLRLIEQKESEIGGRLRVLNHPGAFNFAAMNNRAVKETARGEYLCFLNNDAAPIDGHWLGEMMAHARRPEVGAVGAKLFYGNGKVQHAGVILGIANGQPAEHPYNGLPGDAMGYWGRLHVQQDFSAVTAACMVTRRDVWEKLGGFDEETFAVSYNDVDYCLRAREAGYLIAWTPYARLLHEANASIRTNVEAKPQKDKIARFEREKAAMYERWLPAIARDPAYNRNLSSMGPGFSIEAEGPPTWEPEFRPRERIIVHPADREGCGEYRIIAPSRALARSGIVHAYETMRLMSPPELERAAPDSIVFQRQLEYAQIELIRQVKRMSKAFRVFEIDDLITNLPLKSAYRPAIAGDIGQRMKLALAEVQRLVVSTAPLAKQYGKMVDEVIVLPNRLEKARWLGLNEPKRRGAKPRVGWAGAIGHAGDLALISSVVEATAKNVDWVFMGMCPEPLMPFVAEFHEWVTLEKYPAKLASLDLDLAVAPLELNPFNEAKSNLRLLEYGVLGYPVLCTDIVPYQCDLPVTRLKNRHIDWAKATLELASDREACQAAGQALKGAVLRDWMLEDHLQEWKSAWLP